MLNFSSIQRHLRFPLWTHFHLALHPVVINDQSVESLSAKIIIFTNFPFTLLSVTNLFSLESRLSPHSLDVEHTLARLLSPSMLSGSGGLIHVVSTAVSLKCTQFPKQGIKMQYVT